MIIIYTDGASKGNPGPGGYGVVLISPEHRIRKELSAGFRLTTNNRMELLAVIAGLEALKIPQSEVLIYSDSEYVINSVQKGWLWNWLKKGFKKNEDLWRRFIPAFQAHKVRFEWVKGHAGNKENERCDQLAVAAALQPSLPPDLAYERENKK
jgi:ribonuclease HI